MSRSLSLPRRIPITLAALILVALATGCSLFSPAAETRPIRPGSARDPAGTSSQSTTAQAPAVTLADLSWGWSREEGGFSKDGESATLIAFEREGAQSADRKGLHRVMVAQVTVNQPIPPWAVDLSLLGFHESFVAEIAGTVDTRSMTWVNGPAVGRRSKWSSIEFIAADGVPTKVYSVVFLENRSLAVVATIATQSGARLVDTASLAQDVAARLAAGEDLDLPAMRTFGA